MDKVGTELKDPHLETIPRPECSEFADCYSRSGYAGYPSIPRSPPHSLRVRDSPQRLTAETPLFSGLLHFWAWRNSDWETGYWARICRFSLTEISPVTRESLTSARSIRAVLAAKIMFTLPAIESTIQFSEGTAIEPYHPKIGP